MATERGTQKPQLQNEHAVKRREELPLPITSEWILMVKLAIIFLAHSQGVGIWLDKTKYL